MKEARFCILILVSLVSLKLPGQSIMPDVAWSKGGHAGQILAVALSPDESVVASAASDRTIKLSRFSDFSLLRTLTGHSNSVTSVAFSPDGQFLFSGSSDHTIRRWRVTDGRMTRVWIGATAGVQSIAISSNGLLLAAGGGTAGYPSPFDGIVTMWNVASGAMVWTFTNNVAQVSCVVFSPDGQLIAAACVNGAVFVWEVQSGNLIWSIAGGIGGWNGKVAFSSDGQTLVYGSGSGWSYVGARRVSDGASLWLKTAHQGDVQGLALSADGNLLVSVGSRHYYTTGAETNYPTIMLWNPTNGDRLGIVPTFSASVKSVVLPGGGTHLCTGEGTSLGANNTYLRLWQTNGLLARDWGGHSDRVSALAFSTNGNSLASAGGGDRAVKIWLGSDGELLQTLGSGVGAVTAIAFSSDGSNVVCGDSANMLRSYRVSDGGLVWSKSAYPSTFSAIAFSPNSAVLAVGEASYGNQPYSITLRNETDGAAFRTISGLTNSIIALTMLSSNQVVAVTGDGAVRFWQTNGNLSRSFNVNTGMLCGAFFPDGAALALGYTNREIKLVGLEDGVVQQTFLGHSNPVMRVAVSADGEMLFSTATNELFLWRVADGALLRSYKDEILSPSSLAVSPRGDYFAFGRTDASVLVARKPDFFLPVAQPDSGSLRLRFSGVSGINYTIETSPELQTWSPWSNILCSGPTISVSVPILGSSNCFYRTRHTP